MVRPILAAATSRLPESKLHCEGENRIGEMETFYARLLNLPSPWQVTKVKLDAGGNRVDIWLKEKPGSRFACPECRRLAPVYDHAEENVWRHLDTCQCHTYLHARLPRVRRRIRASFRYSLVPGAHDDDTGFRLAQDL